MSELRSSFDSTYGLRDKLEAMCSAKLAEALGLEKVAMKPKVVKCRYFYPPGPWGVIYSASGRPYYDTIDWRFQTWREALNFALGLYPVKPPPRFRYGGGAGCGGHVSKDEPAL